jgi:multidrug transporter EmrE-like cation transporter
VTAQSTIVAEQALTVRRSRLSPAHLGVLLLAVGLAATGQVLLKHGMSQSAYRAQHSATSLLVDAIGNVWMWSGLILFGISAVAWLVTLAHVPLAIAYPFNALGYLGILAASVFVLGERANAWTLLGSGLVVGGLIIVVTLSPAGG